jgi:hypothetical protein
MTWVVGILVGLWIVVVLGVMMLGVWTMIQKRLGKRRRQ